MDPPRGPRPRMTQRFLRSRLCPQVSARSPARHQPADSLRQRTYRRRGPGSPGRRQPSVHGPDLSRTVDPAGMEGWERDRGAQMLPGISSSSSERLSVPTGGGKLECISLTATSHPELDSNFPPRVGGCTAQSNPAAAAGTRGPCIASRGRQRPITERLGRERLEGAGSRRATATKANREPKLESSPHPADQWKRRGCGRGLPSSSCRLRVAVGRRP